jgi:hypothetical protein
MGFKPPKLFDKSYENKNETGNRYPQTQILIELRTDFGFEFLNEVLWLSEDFFIV